MRNGGIRLIICAALAALATGFATPAHAQQGNQQLSRRLVQQDAPAVAARAAYLFDATTGTVRLSKQATRRLPVASLTKVMTAYVVLREAKPDDVVTINSGDVRHATTNGATAANLRAGERLTVRDLLYGAMLPSGADATHALARVYGPGDSRFVAKMNATARSLGLTRTRYGNPDGLPKPSPGYSTAQDQAKLAEVALRDPVLLAIASTARHAVAASKVHLAHVWTNSNKLLGASAGAVGLKTGYTQAAGYCLSFAADRDGHRIVGVLLGDSSATRRFQTAARLLNWAGEQTAGGGSEDV
ncbi:D-alanyl-D-alanine carboxypeptidase (penicillin-binding protein 5/6) [Streptosporangium album]|uniref:D-alanyl-D-alanine carboxypeptidase (Penicillin-binding protein 5/6) n=1 Tax=Streptosporangium album TaxID=47479 RepID=A0A7W7RR96_9ACTN|nr:serine hydrolase [Streptosporangium album]MBB4936684.1 D-alanyl-D-alanine carboxypeptidase (penicillin-binding protein 5/6) [Streptosporangium album]